MCKLYKFLLPKQNKFFTPTSLKATSDKLSRLGLPKFVILLTLYMDRYKKLAIVTAVVLLTALGTYTATRQYFKGQVKVLYSLDEKKNNLAIIDLIDNAEKYVYFAVYTFTRDDIADALIAAKNRGVTVEGITDLGQSQEDFQKPTIKKLTDAKILVETQKHTSGIMHIKAVVTDRGYASGSYNWTQSATVANDEVLEIGTGGYLHDRYLEIIKRVLADNAGSYATVEPAVSGSEVSQSSEDESLKNYSYTEAGAHIGENAIVTGPVVKVYTSSKNTTFFDYCLNYKSCGFSVVVFSSDKNKFSNLSQYQGKTVSIKGKIQSYQGQAEIILSSPDQIVK